MAITLKLNDEAFKSEIRKATAAGLQRAGVFLHARCVQAVNKSNTFRHVAKLTGSQSTNRGGQKSGVTYSNLHNAFAGQPPFKRTGVGQAAIVYEYNGNEKDPRVRVGVRASAIYLLYLELGTRRIGKRPWLLATFNKNRKAIEKLCTMGGKG